MIISQLRDFDTDQPIVDAHIYIEGDSTIGTVSDDIGSFAINPQQGKSIIISHINYGQYEFQPSEIDSVVYLLPTETQLDEVVINSKPKTNWFKWAAWLGAAAVVIKVAKGGSKPSKALGKPAILNVEL